MMKFSKIKTNLKLAVAVLTIAATLVGCTGMSPYEPRNNREEGPEKGLFSGAQGEFVIFQGDLPEKSGKTDQEDTSPKE